MSKKANKSEPLVPEQMTFEEFERAFGTNLLSVDPSDVKGALLTGDRLVLYTTAEKRQGRIAYTIFRHGLMLRGIFPDEQILEEGIAGLMPPVETKQLLEQHDKS